MHRLTRGKFNRERTPVLLHLVEYLLLDRRSARRCDGLAVAGRDGLFLARRTREERHIRLKLA